MTRTLIFMTAFVLAGCQSDAPAPETVGGSNNALPAITQALTCLKNTGPIIAAHRGRDKLKRHPENAVSSLRALKQDGFIIAEIDIARLKDGTHILHHDGVWDDTTTGSGVVASTTWDKAEKFLLKTRKSGPLSERLTTLRDIMAWADRDFYLELDFKSSANETAVLNAVKDAGMTQHVILIAYSSKQAQYLQGLSKRITGETMLVSGPHGRTGVHWLGTKAFNPSRVKSSQFTAHGMMSPKYAKSADYSALSIIVSDFPSEAKAKAGIRQTDRRRVKACAD